MKIIINESQLDIIKEAALDSFDINVLSSLKTFKDRQKYCINNLGAPIGNGSSRQVFQINDEKVLKLAKNSKGLAQNEFEGQPDYYKAELSIFPKVFKTSDDYSWIISEFVLPAKPQDFVHCLGMTFNEWKMFVITLGRIHRNNMSPFLRGSDKNSLWKLCDNNEFVHDLDDFIGSYDSFALNDLFAIQNYGLAKRNGKAQLVILDSGLSDEIYKQYYRR